MNNDKTNNDLGFKTLFRALKIAYHNVSKVRKFNLLNIFGLTIGLAAFILIMIFVIDEYSYDRHFAKSERIYRLIQIYNQEGVGERSASCPFPVAHSIAKEYPSLIENSARLFNYQKEKVFISIKKKVFEERNLFFADSSFLNIFDIKIVKHSKSMSFNHPFTVLITESTAQKYFGDENPIGKRIYYEQQIPFTVIGIIEDIPNQTHFSINVLASFSSLNYMIGELQRSWIWNPCWTYLLLREDANPKQLSEKFPFYMENYFYDAEKDYMELKLQPIEKIHLYSDLDYEIEENGNHLYIKGLIIIAILILCVAIINYINLTTASAGLRTKEIGVRKIVGASRFELAMQFIFEAVILTTFSIALALIIVELVLPYFSDYTDKYIDLEFRFTSKVLLFILGLWLFTGFFSGIYPAIRLTKISPLLSIKKYITREGQHNALSRKILVITQYTVSIIMIILTITAFQQFYYMLHADLGFHRENIVLLHTNLVPVAAKYDKMKKKLLKYQSIQSVTAMNYIIGTDHNIHEFRPEGYPDDKWLFFPALVVREDFLETFEIDVIAGTGFTDDIDFNRKYAVLINEAMLDYLDWDKSEAIGKKFKTRTGHERVIGVVDNFNVTSLHQKVVPFVINMKETPKEIFNYTKYFVIRSKKGSLEQAINDIETVWNKETSNRVFKYTLLENELKKMYKNENMIGRLFAFFTVLAIFIACLGMVGLTIDMTKRRTKEIGIRKVNGATATDIIRLFLREFLALILTACLIAFILAWIWTENWLNSFAYHVIVNPFVYIISAIIITIITLSVVSVQTIKAANTNPVNALKYE